MQLNFPKPAISGSGIRWQDAGARGWSAFQWTMVWFIKNYKENIPEKERLYNISFLVGEKICLIPIINIECD
jgi:inner membrane protein involved in colicin E2 resistance